jgi:hypothetical protein
MLMKLREAVEDMEVLGLQEGLWTFSEEEETLGLRERSRKALEWVTVFTSVIKAVAGVIGVMAGVRVSFNR